MSTAAVKDGMFNDLILTCGRLATRQEYFATKHDSYEEKSSRFLRVFCEHDCARFWQYALISRGKVIESHQKRAVLVLTQFIE